MEHLYKVSFSDAEVDSCLKEANTDSKVNSADPHPFTAFGGIERCVPGPLQKSHVHIVFEHSSGTSVSPSLIGFLL